MKVKAPWVLLILVSFCAELISGSFTRSLGGSIDAADRIAVLEITSGLMIENYQGGKGCRYKYGVMEIQNLRGQEVLELRTDSKLTIGEKYLLISKNKIEVNDSEMELSTIGPFETGCDVDARSSHVITFDEIFEISEHYGVSDASDRLLLKRWVKFPAGAYSFDGISAILSESRTKTLRIDPYIPADATSDYVEISELERKSMRFPQ